MSDQKTRLSYLRQWCCLGWLVCLVTCNQLIAMPVVDSNFSGDPRAQGWSLSDWNMETQASGGWVTNGFISTAPGFSPFWISPSFVVAPLEYFRITAVSRGSVGLCGAGYNLGTTWGRYPNANYQGLLVADDWTVTLPQTNWQTNIYCSRCLVNATSCVIRLAGGEVQSARVELVSRDEVRAWADAVYAAMPPVNFTAARDHLVNLNRTRLRLRQRQDVTVVLLGDSIMNDTGNSTFDVLLERACSYGGSVRVRAITAVGGGVGIGQWAADTNWNWPNADLDLQQAVIGQQPDLVIIGGISNGTDYDAFGVVIDRIISGVSQQFGYTPDILLMTGAFGTGQDADGYAEQLQTLAAQRGIGFMDMRSVWSNYMATAVSQGWPESQFYRDDTHANQFGKQILGRTLATELTPDPLRILTIQPTNGLVNLTWASEPGLGYSLWAETELSSAGWILVTNATATTTNMSATVNPGGQREFFYRVSTP